MEIISGEKTYSECGKLQKSNGNNFKVGSESRRLLYNPHIATACYGRLEGSPRVVSVAMVACMMTT